MKAVVAGLALALGAGGMSTATAADLPYGYGHKRHHREVSRDDRVVRTFSVANRLDVRTYPYLHYEMRSEMICKLKWLQTRHGREYPGEVCVRW